MNTELTKKELFLSLMHIAKQLHQKEEALVNAFGKEFPPFVDRAKWELEELVMFKMMGFHYYDKAVNNFYEGKITADELYKIALNQK